ncbi:MAG: vitamin B12-dependent ribonucleotide reductase [Nitrososphaerales archaeon]
MDSNSWPKQIVKRDGRVEAFKREKIVNAVLKALTATKQGDGKTAEKIADKVISMLRESLGRRIPKVEEVQDLVEKALIEEGLAEAAKAYILYRKKRAEVRAAKSFFGVVDDLKLSVNAAIVLQKRYLRRDDTGRVIETPSEMFKRVAHYIAKVESRYGGDTNRAEKDFYNIMASLEFLPNSPTLMNAGTPMGQLSACFVLPVEDSIRGIFDAIKYMALIHQSGGGTGFSFSKLRPKGDIVRSTHGVASGPVSFMRVFDAAADVIKQGGRRRGANMGVLDVTHPDIMEFIGSKSTGNTLTNFNISVAVSDDFMKRVEAGEEYSLINPRTGQEVKKMLARSVFDYIVTMAWATGDPGLIFIDRINESNPTPHIGRIESTNPCGEQPLLPYESCNLGSINLAKMVKDGKIDWSRLKEVARLAVLFLDDVIDANKYPLKKIERVTKSNRKIGVGVMGFAEMLIQLGIPYASDKALQVASEVMKFISDVCRERSKELGEERGSFPNFEGSVWEKRGYNAMRNATVTTIAPTGTISIIAGCSSGIEPIFAVSYVRNVLEGTRLLEVNRFFEEAAKREGFYSEQLMLQIAKTGTLKNVNGIPEKIKELFQTAFDVPPEWHVKMQAAFQRYTDNAVSKTVNLPNEATPDDVRKIYLLAYKLGCKGITVYRYGSKSEQVLYLGSLERPDVRTIEQYVGASSEYAGGCPTPACGLY